MKTLGLASILLAMAMACAGSAYAEESSAPADESPSPAASEQPEPPKRHVLPRRVGKVDVSEAARRLEQARLARQKGAEPRPGEYVVVHGVKHVNYRYWKRQEKLRVAVEAAQRR